MRGFFKRKETPETGGFLGLVFFDLPVGTYVQTEVGDFLISRVAGKKVRNEIPTKRILDSWSLGHPIRIKESALSEFPIHGKVGFRPGSIVRECSTGEVYLVDGNRKVRVDDEEILFVYGLSRQDVLEVSSMELDLHGEVI